MQRKYRSLMEFSVRGKGVRWTGRGNDGIAPTLGGKVVQQGDAVKGGDGVRMQEDATGAALQHRIVQRCDEVFMTEFGTPNGDGGSKDNEYGSLVTLRQRQTSPSTICEKIGPSRFAVDKIDAVIELLYSHWDGLERIPLLPYCIVLVFFCPCFGVLVFAIVSSGVT